MPLDKHVSDEGFCLYHSWDSEGSATHLEACKQPKSEGPCNATYTENWYKAEDVDVEIAQLRAQLESFKRLHEENEAIAIQSTTSAVNLRGQLAAAEKQLLETNILCDVVKSDRHRYSEQLAAAEKQLEKETYWARHWRDTAHERDLAVTEYKAQLAAAEAKIERVRRKALHAENGLIGVGVIFEAIHDTEAQ